VTTLTLASLTTNQPMGQQVYEREVSVRAALLLGEGWAVRHRLIGSLRSTSPELNSISRIPARILTQGSAPLRRATGGIVYRGSTLVHRFDLRLPPAPREVLTVLDVAWRFPDEARPSQAALAEARRAQAVICPSQFSADEVSRELGVSDPITIPLGVGRPFLYAEPMADPELALFGIRRPFVLHAGGCTLRKNLAALAEAWPVVHGKCPDTTLVLLGPQDPRRDTLFAPLDGTALIGRVDSGAVPRIMAAASAVVYPSVYEGFGLPALEALATGAPLVASRCAALPEVCGDAAVLVEPTGPSIADGLVFALQGGPEVEHLRARGRARAAGSTWEATAAAHARVWRALAP
jgi:glycosyltransferase involved in cell wall biosynthesis